VPVACGRAGGDATETLGSTSLDLAPAPFVHAGSPEPPRGDEPPVPMPRPARRRLDAAVSDNAACEACHDDVSREWRGSYHQLANVEPAYQQAFAVEPMPFCRGCHAPEANPLAEPSAAVSALGVGCVTCHVTEEGVVLAAAHSEGTAVVEQVAPHPLRRSQEFAQAGGCAHCHEFRFPMPGGSDDAFFMQTTVREHQRSSAASTPCADCHMPLHNGRRSHTFAEVRDEAWLRARLDADAEQTAEGSLRVTLTPRQAGHAFPTGDLFRRLEVGYALRGREGQVLRTETRHLARHFELLPGQPGRRLTADDRVFDEPKNIELELPSREEAPDATEVAWWVSYQRVATVGRGTSPEDVVVESEVKLRSGSLPWNQPPPAQDLP